MSLASDRAEAIAAWTKTNGRRLVFLMPKDFTCRIVALSPDSELLDWLDNQGAKFIGEFGSLNSARDIETAIWRAWKVPRGTAASVRH